MVLKMSFFKPYVSEAKYRDYFLGHIELIGVDLDEDYRKMKTKSDYWETRLTCYNVTAK